MNASQRVFVVVALAAALAACTPAAGPDESAESVPARAAEPVEIPSVGSNAEQPRLVVAEGGELLLAWTARGDDGVDVFLARSEGTDFVSATRVNNVPGSVNPNTIDEMRPSVAAGPGNRVAVAWTDPEFDIQLALSEDGGSSFGDAIRLNQDEGDAMQEFPSIAFDENGVLHAVWLDPRVAEDIVEEPADLYYARVENGTVTERNLTADQESSVCGCCLPDLQIDGDDILITFRNTTDAGYRDPFQIRGTIAGDFGQPTETTAPVWMIYACPVAGPIGFEGHAVWLDGSMGKRRLLESQGAGREPKVILEDTDEWFLDYPARRIPGAGAESLLLVPSVPAYVIRHDGEDWNVVIDNLPGWVTSAAADNGDLVVVGSSDGRFVQSRQPLPN